MTDIQFFVLLGTVLAGVIWQRVDLMHVTGRIDKLNDRIDQVATQLNGRIDQLAIQLNGRIDRVGDDLRQFYQILGKHDKAIEALEKRP